MAAIKRSELHQLRSERGLTQQQMADRLNITRSFYGMIETGDRNPTLPLARKIAELLDSDIETLFFDQHQNGAKECEDKGIMSKDGVKKIRRKKNGQI